MSLLMIASGVACPDGCIGVAAQPASDPRVHVSQPIHGQEFAPGDAVSIVVEIAPALKATDGQVGVKGQGLLKATRFAVTPYEGGGVVTRYEARFVIPQTHAGPLEITPFVVSPAFGFISGPGVTVMVRPRGLPSRFDLVNRIYMLAPPTGGGSSEQLFVRGTYPRGIERDLTSSSTGTLYESSDPAIVAVDAEGRCAIIGRGVAAVRVRHGSLTDFAMFVIEDSAHPFPPHDVSDRVAIRASALQPAHQPNAFVQREQDISITNTSSFPLIGPLYLVLTGAPSVPQAVFNRSGLTRQVMPLRTPYLRLQLRRDGLTLQPGESESLRLQLGDGPVNYEAKLFRSAREP